MSGDEDAIDLPIARVRALNAMSMITHGYLLALDRLHPAATTFFNNDPEFAPAGIRYQRSDGQWITVPNQGLHMHKYFDDDKHSTIIQLWWDNVTVMKEPYAALYGSGL